jgi:PPM family protein phosphatase
MKIERGYAQHVGSRNEQQDAGLVLADDGRGEQLIVVADGMGGHAGGSLASAQVAETAKRIWGEHLKTPLEPKRLLERIIREGHESINRVGAEKGLTPRSTCALFFLRNGNAHWAHIGDSRIYRLRDGQVSRLTRDHSVVQMLVDLGKVSEEEMGTHPDQNRLTQSLGGDATPMPDFGTDGVKPHDAFLVCSDGLWEMIPQAEMAAALAAKKLGDDGAKHLVDRAFDRAKPKSDNITVALVRVDGPPPAGIGIGADPEDARTTRMPGREPRRAPGGTRWAFLAATLVAVGAAAAVVYKPWDKQGSDTTPAVTPKVPDIGKPPGLEKPPDSKPEPRTEPPKTEPKPEGPKLDPAAPVPRPEPKEPPPSTPNPEQPRFSPTEPGQPAPSQPAPAQPQTPERGSVPPQPKPAAPVQPAPPDAKKPETPTNTDKAPDAPKPPEPKPQ